ncbi:MAG: TRAP transporter large permease, partial [Pseudomonadota bacterium]
ILIPPSITMIIYGNLAGVSIGHCFIAGIIPGIICALSFVVLVEVWGRLSPQSLPTVAPSTINMRLRLKALIRLIPSVGIIFIVLGGIYLGITTPTEAGTIGAFAALILCIIQRDLTFKKLLGVLLSTVRTTSFIMLIVASASVISFVMQYLRVPELLTQAVIQMEVSPYIVLSLFYLLYLVLGTLIDPVSMMVMTVPTILPTIELLGFDPIWFAVVITITCEIGLITPPVGLNLYILRGISDTPLGDIALGAAPFVLVLVIDLVIFTAFPILSLWLPHLMR